MRYAGKVSRGLLALKQNDELVAPQPCNRIRLAQTTGNTLRHLDDQLISSTVTIGVIDPFEMVEIEETETKRTAIARDPHMQLIETITEQNTVWQAGQAVMMRHVTDLFLSRLAIGNIGK